MNKLYFAIALIMTVTAYVGYMILQPVDVQRISDVILEEQLNSLEKIEIIDVNDAALSEEAGTTTA